MTIVESITFLPSLFIAKGEINLFVTTYSIAFLFSTLLAVNASIIFLTCSTVAKPLYVQFA